MKVLFVGDIVGNPGRKTARRVIPLIRKELSIDFCIANGENSAGGLGITNAVAQELYGIGFDAITLGNHTWSKTEALAFLDDDRRIVRPANFHPDLPGNGSALIKGDNKELGLVNVQGRTFMENIDCPFRSAEKEIDYLSDYTKNILVDFHAEATSEKIAMGWYLNGKVSCVLGTHTHVQSADERVLPGGTTAYITDVGMTGPRDGIIGVERDAVIDRFIKNLPGKFHVASGAVQFNSVLIEIDSITGKAVSIERVNRFFDNIE
ncbi:MAG: TIGR00282 family metallophosphoesterase [Eubacteriales bacterium]|nr:TIGR00282 family metallophosphoesterase [Eubacteriales bacterium]